MVNIEAPAALDFVCDQFGLTHPGRLWSNASKRPPHPVWLGLITDAFDRLGIVGEERFNPFVIRSLLTEADRQLLERFLTRHRDRIHLGTHAPR